MYFSYRGFNVYYETCGDRAFPPLLFLHGFGGSTDSFKSATDCLKRRRFCVALDFSGFGKSETPTVPLCLSDYAAEVEALLDELKIEKCDLVSHSFGGRVAIKLLAESKRIRRAVLCAAAGVKTERGIAYYIAVARYKLYKLLRRDVSAFGSKDYKSLSGAMKKTFVFVVNEDLTKLLKKISAPCLVVSGEGDTAVSARQTRLTAKKIKGAKHITLPSGHFCYLHNNELFCEITEDFLNEDIGS